MRVFLAFAATWATFVAPHLCRIGVIDACCAEDAPLQITAAATSADDAIADEVAACSTCCSRDGAPSSGEPASTDPRDCESCGNFCGAVVKPAGGENDPDQMRPNFLAMLAAPLDDETFAPASLGLRPLTGSQDPPHLPRPPSDCPLLI